jgi:hypothetical protein
MSMPIDMANLLCTKELSPTMSIMSINSYCVLYTTRVSAAPDDHPIGPSHTRKFWVLIDMTDMVDATNWEVSV